MAKRTETYRSRLDHDPATMGVSVLLSCLLSCLVVLLLFPPQRRDESIEESLRRFGYEGPTRYQREIQIRLPAEEPLILGQNRLMGGLTRSEATKTDGAPVAVQAEARQKGKERRFPGLAGLAASGDAASRLRALHVQVIQSEDLITVLLVRPEYPREAIAHGDTGRVELAGLVNVHGVVEDVLVMHSAGELLDQAATEALRESRFLPYRNKEGVIEATWAAFNYRFNIEVKVEDCPDCPVPRID